MGFRLTAEAEEDTIDIAEAGVRLFWSAQARRYHDELYALFDLIAANPRMARERPEITPPMRIHPFKAASDRLQNRRERNIFVVRIRHGHEDWLEG